MSIILVTLESVLSDKFIIFINWQHMVGWLDWIIIDKYYIVLNNQVDFWPQMQWLGQLIHAQTQIILLTAILPLSKKG